MFQRLYTFLEKIMELGAMEDRACSDTEIKLIKNEAEELYNNHLAELKVLNIDDVSNIKVKSCVHPLDKLRLIEIFSIHPKPSVIITE